MPKFKNYKSHNSFTIYAVYETLPDKNTFLTEGQMEKK